jgi:subtilase family serine protease
VPSVPSGTYYLFVVVDDPAYGQIIYESNKTNNTSAAVHLEVGSPDLAVGNIVTPASAVIAQPVQIGFTITNEGTADALGPWLNQILLCSNTNGIGAQPVGTIAFTNILTAGSSTNITQTVILPVGISGAQYFGVVADSGEVVPELNRSNNTAFGTTPIIITGPDLDMEQLGAPSSALFGQSFTVTFAVTNIGGRPPRPLGTIKSISVHLQIPLQAPLCLPVCREHHPWLRGRAIRARCPCRFPWHAVLRRAIFTLLPWQTPPMRNSN